MIEIIIIAKTIAASVVRWVNINALYSSLIPLEQRSQRQKIITFYNKVIIITKLRYMFIYPPRVDTFHIHQYLWIKKPVNFIRSKCLIIENLRTFLILFRLSTLEYTVLVREYKFNLSGSRNHIAIFVNKTNLIFETGIAIW